MFARGIIRLFGMALSVLCLSAALLPSQQVEAETGTVCTSEVIAAHQWLADPHTDGAYVAWQAMGPDRHHDIYLYNIATGITTNISADVADYNASAKVNGDYVVWRGEDDVFLHDILTGAATKLSDTQDGHTYDAPVIAGHYVAWQGEDHTDSTSDIYLYDINTSTTINLSSNPDLREFYPQIDGQYLIWLYYAEDDHGVYLYDLIEGSGRTISDAFDTTNYPARIDGQYVVWGGEEWRDGEFVDAEIYLYDIATQTGKNISQMADSADYYPEISGNLVAWGTGIGEAGVDGHIYLYDIATETRKRIATLEGYTSYPQIDGRRVVWEGVWEGMWLYDDESEMLQQLEGNPDDVNYSVSIAGDTIVWVSFGKLYMATCENSEPPVITD